jgi:hypothetical protein
VVQRADRYLVELQAPEAGWKDVDDLIRRAREAPGPDGEARFVRAIFLPEDSSFLLLYEAGSARDAAAAAAALEFEVERVSEAVPADLAEERGGTC